MSDFNQRVIEEFRANGGVVGGPFAGAPLVLITTTGAKSGEPRVSPLMCQPAEGDTVYIFGSKAGAPSNPAWVHNLRANPNLTVERGTETYAAVGHEITGPERDEIFARQVAAVPQFGEYEQKAGRVIPVFALERA